MVDVKIGIPLILSSSLFAPLGAYVTAKVNLNIFTIILAVVIFLAAVRMLFSGEMETLTAPIGSAYRIFGGCMIGTIVGFSAGLLGIGGGVFIVPMLIYILKISTKTAAATSIFIVVFSSFSGFLAHIAIAPPDWKFILTAAVFSIAGGQLGSRIMAEKLKGRTIRKIFGAVLLIFVVKLFQKVIF